MKGVGHTETKVRMLFAFNEGNVAHLTSAFFQAVLSDDHNELTANDL